MRQIELVGIERVFTLGDSEVHALRAVDFAVAPGEYVAVMGPSGSGKSTLLNILGLLDRPDAGRYRLEGRDVTTLSADEQAQVRRGRIGFVFQSFHLVPRLTAAENIALPLMLGGVAPDERASRVADALRDFGLSDRAGHRPDQLSGGQQQRVAISRALEVNPSALLFDEPLSNLDARLRVEMRSELLAIHRRRPFTAVYVTHDQEEAMTMATRIGLLEQGKLHQVGLPQELYRQPVNRFVAEFMGPMNWLPSPLHATRDGNLLLLETPLGIFRAFPPQSVSGNLVVNSPLLAMEGLGEGGSRETGRRDVGSEGGPPVVPLVKGDNSSGQLNFQTCSQGSPSAGQKVLAGFRPSSVSFSPGSTDQTNTISCEILETQYAGDFQHLTVRPWMAQGKSADAQFQLMEPNPHRVRQRGERIEIGVAPEQVIVLKE